MKPVRIGILGLGTVGSGTVEVLRGNAAEISRRLGRAVEVFMVSTRNAEKARAVCPPETIVVSDPFEVVRHPEVDIVAELYGGTDTAKELVFEAVRHGKHIVTANKKLLAEHGSELFALAEKHNVMVQFEAAVAGGIPIIKALREGLAANRIRSIAGRDIKYAEELGYRIKLLGITRRSEKGIELRVHPTLLPESRLLANVNGVMNAVRVNADMVGETLFYGAGAGALPTASAVVADIIDISRLIAADSGHRVPYLAFQPAQVQAQTMLPMDEITSSYYLRVQAEDKPGVLGQIANLLAAQNVSIEALIQKGVLDGHTAEIVILTHSTVEKHIKAAIAAIEALDTVGEKVVMIRMESLHD